MPKNNFRSPICINNSIKIIPGLLNLIIMFLVPTYVLTSQEQSGSDSLSVEAPNTTQSVVRMDTSSNSLLADTSQYLTEQEFYYADTRRYSLDGGMPRRNTKLDPLATTCVAGGWVGIFAFQHYLQMNTIWKEQGNFKFFEDGKYALYADKAGHIFGTYLSAYLVRETMVLSGFSWDASNIIAAALGLAYTTYVEILDGYGINWGFSPSDWYSDIGGAAFFLGQHYIPFLQNFTPKFMFFPADWHGEKRRVPHDAFIDDYSSHTMWMSVNVHNLLPESMKSYWPSWLELSFGYAARNLCTPGFGCTGAGSDPHYDNGQLIVYGDPKFIISLDYNLTKLLPDDGSFWNWLRQSLNLFKWPSPSIEFGKETRFYLLYPFALTFH